ncbi:hypothetical protein IQ07DRAFT_55857 [Pyrenochaeta sp. DS3sAY3a]|nr:hypothetical protein IQ07DRAFT_55857 [Pyrenochaeta sp. DS3sAY3a]
MSFLRPASTMFTDRTPLRVGANGQFVTIHNPEPAMASYSSINRINIYEDPLPAGGPSPCKFCLEKKNPSSAAYIELLMQSLDMNANQRKAALACTCDDDNASEDSEMSFHETATKLRREELSAYQRDVKRQEAAMSPRRRRNARNARRTLMKSLMEIDKKWEAVVQQHDEMHWQTERAMSSYSPLDLNMAFGNMSDYPMSDPFTNDYGMFHPSAPARRAFPARRGSFPSRVLKPAVRRVGLSPSQLSMSSPIPMLSLRRDVRDRHPARSISLTDEQRRAIALRAGLERQTDGQMDVDAAVATDMEPAMETDDETDIEPTMGIAMETEMETDIDAGIDAGMEADMDTDTDMAAE